MLHEVESAHARSLLIDMTAESFKKIAPFWPLKNLIAVNPLQGFEDFPIEKALQIGASYFEQEALPLGMEAVNRETIKWMQAYFDEGQATLPMPLREQGLYPSWRQLALYDMKLHENDREKQHWLSHLPKTAELAIAQCLLRLNITKDERKQFFTLMLTTLPGWAAYVKYRTEWAGLDATHPYPVSQLDYLALRLILATLLWPRARTLLDFYASVSTKGVKSTARLESIEKAERAYRKPLLEKLAVQALQVPHIPEAQLVFCIDVRSEPFRRALEATGDYQTFGFAGFFGIPVKVTDTITNESYFSCPVLISPKHEVKESPCSLTACDHDRQGYARLTLFKRLYQSLKYTFTTPFALVECLGLLSGVWMCLRSLAPRMAAKVKNSAIQTIRKNQEVESSIEHISFPDQCAYAEGALKMMGLTNHFAPIVIFCGHGSTTQNNAYATALDCGACGGRHGAPNARILAAILNRLEVRSYLSNNGIFIPQTTHFVAAEHNTTTDEVILYGTLKGPEIHTLKQNLEKARVMNSFARLQKMGKKTKLPDDAVADIALRAQDWAQVRPEWGLARNTAFIVAPRDITSAINLEGRCFLHSYDYTQDTEGSSLTTILTAPMVVAQWINAQYLFSTLDNVAYGGGSKITKNITGKMGIMQGNASDLMTGLPLQSVYSSDIKAYHEPQRLMSVVFAPKQLLDSIIQAQPVLKKLFGNGWVQLACIEPHNRIIYLLSRDLTWQQMN